MAVVCVPSFGGKAAHPPVYSSLSLSFSPTLVNCHWKPLGISLYHQQCTESWLRVRTSAPLLCPGESAWQSGPLGAGRHTTSCPPTAPCPRSHASVGDQGLEVLPAGGQPAGTAEEWLLLPPAPSGLARRARGNEVGGMASS